MKKHTPILAATAAAALLLAGCSSSSDPAASATPSDTPAPSASASPTAQASETPNSVPTASAASLEAVGWTEGDGPYPTLQLAEPFVTEGSGAIVKVEGDGAAIEASSAVTVQYTVYSGADGTMQYSTYDEDMPFIFTLDPMSIDPNLIDALAGQSVGTQLLYGSPDVSATEEGAPGSLMALTVIDAKHRAVGTDVEPVEGLPTVTLDNEGAPSVDFTGTSMPDELVSQILIEGDGEPLTTDQTVFAQYTGWLWDGEVFDSSWERGMAADFSLQGVIQGWTQGLEGVPVGSQVLLVIPPELGYGDEASETIPANSTLVFVVDVLAAQ